MKADTQREWLRLLREKKRLTADGLATVLWVSRMTIHRWEAGVEKSKPTLAQAVALAKLAAVSVDEVAQVFGG